MGTDVLMKWKDVFTQSNLFFSDIFVWLGWALVSGLKMLADAAEKLIDAVYKLLDFTSYAGMDKFFSTSDFRLLLAVLFAGALIVFGMTLIFQRDKEKPKVLQNLLIAIMVITALPSLMTMLNGLTIQAKDIIMGDYGSTADRIIADNVIDLVYLDSQGFNNYVVEDGRVSSPSGKAVNGFSGDSAKNVQFINVQEKITDERKNDLNSPEYFFNVLKTNSDGTLAVQELKADKIFGLDFTNWYYRYNVDYLVIYISLIATAIALFFVAFKVSKLIFDLAVHGFLAVIFSASDLTNGQRTKKVLQSICSIYVVLILAVVMIKFFYLGQAYISANISNGLIKAIVLIFFAFAVIDGPNIIESVLGIDVGLKSGFQTMATMFMASRMVTSAAGSAARLGGRVLGGAVGGTQGAVRSGIENFRNETNNSSQEQSEDNTKIQSDGQDKGENNLYGDNAGQPAGENSENNTNGSPQSDSDNTGALDSLNNQDNMENSAVDMTEQATEKAHGAENNLNADLPLKQQGTESNTNDVTNIDAANNNLNSDQQQQQKPEKEKIEKSGRSTKPLQPVDPRTITGATRQSYRTGKAVGNIVGGGVGKAAGKIANKIKQDDLKGDK